MANIAKKITATIVIPNFTLSLINAVLQTAINTSIDIIIPVLSFMTVHLISLLNKL